MAGTGRVWYTVPMLALLFDGNCNVHIENRPEPERRDGEVMVQVTRSGVCQTDFAVYHGSGSDRVLGSEFTGRVIETGPETMDFKKGDRVVCYPHRPCGSCAVCRAGNGYLCPVADGLRDLSQGGFAEYVSLPEQFFLPLPDDIDDELGVLIPHDLGMMWYAMQSLRIKPGDLVAVAGLQPFGLGAVALAKLGTAKTVGFDVAKRRRSIAATLGADITIDSTEPCLDDRIEELTGGAMFDHVVECGEPMLQVERLVSWVRPGGKLCIMGHSGKTFQIDTESITQRDVLVTGAPRYPAHLHDDVCDLLRRCTAARSMITNRPTLKESKKDLHEYVIDRTGKVVLNMTED